MPESTTVAIVGGGPAGMMLGALLARQRVNVIVLEKHADFLRDFRGDTVHPSTIELMYELGWADEFLALPHGPLDLHAALVVSAEGRNSVLRDIARLTPVVVAPGIDVFWFRVSRRTDESAPFFQSGRGGSLVAVDRGTYWQLAYAFPKGRADAIRSDGIQSFGDRIAVLLPMLADRLDEVTSFDDVHLLSVRMDRLTQWYRPGLLFIGDAAHAMSPAGGVGINLAIQDAVAAANRIGPALVRDGGVTTDVLRKIQRRRTFPAVVTQRFQAAAAKGLYADVVSDERRTPKFLRAMRSVPALTRVTGRFIGLGIRPEHVKRLGA